MNITDDQVRGALLAQDRKVSELKKYPICENYSRTEIDVEGMRAALTAFLSSVGGEPVAEIQLSDDGYKIGLLGPLRAHRLPLGTKLYTAEALAALAARVAGGGEPVGEVTGNEASGLQGFLAYDGELPVGTKLYTHPATDRGAGGEYIDTMALRMLIAAGHVSQNLVDQSLSIARGVLPGPIELATHPATARAGVDLEQFRFAVEVLKERSESTLRAHEYHYGKPARPDGDLVLAVAEADRLLALIDQQGADRG